ALRSTTFPYTTLFRSEIAAAALGLAALKEPCRVNLNSDSKYVIETMRGRFRRKANHDWWKRLDEASARHEIEWQWAQGHAGHVRSEEHTSELQSRFDL